MENIKDYMEKEDFQDKRIYKNVTIYEEIRFEEVDNYKSFTFSSLKDCNAEACDFEPEKYFRFRYQGDEARLSSCYSDSCDFLEVIGCFTDEEGRKHSVPVYVELGNEYFEEIGEGHWENQNGERVDKNGNLINENGDIIQSDEGDEEDCYEDNSVKWVFDDERASYPYLLEDIKRLAEENDIDISHIKFEEV